MAETGVALKAVDRLEITTLVDNSIDVFLPSTGEVGARRYQQIYRGESVKRLLPSTATQL